MTNDQTVVISEQELVDPEPDYDCLLITDQLALGWTYADAPGRGVAGALRLEIGVDEDELVRRRRPEQWRALLPLLTLLILNSKRVPSPDSGVKSFE